MKRTLTASMAEALVRLGFHGQWWVDSRTAESLRRRRLIAPERQLYRLTRDGRRWLERFREGRETIPTRTGKRPFNDTVKMNRPG